MSTFTILNTLIIEGEKKEKKKESQCSELNRGTFRKELPALQHCFSNLVD
jgi:hypothetical protein